MKSLEEFEAAARSMRTLADTLDQHPEMLIYGKKGPRRRRDEKVPVPVRIGMGGSVGDGRVRKLACHEILCAQLTAGYQRIGG